MNQERDTEAVLPAKQLRSQRRRRAILDAAHRLLESVGYDSMKMEEIAAEANSSVGTLYQRFRDKDGLLDALLVEISEKQRERILSELSAANFRGTNRREALQRIIGLIVAFFRDNPGFIRAVISRRISAPDAVSPLRPVAQETVLKGWEAFATNFPDADNEECYQRFRFALQIALSVSSNAVLNRPGPVLIDDPALPALLTDVAENVMESGSLSLGKAAIKALDLSGVPAGDDGAEGVPGNL